MKCFKRAGFPEGRSSTRTRTATSGLWVAHTWRSLPCVRTVRIHRKRHDVCATQGELNKVILAQGRQNMKAPLAPAWERGAVKQWRFGRGSAARCAEGLGPSVKRLPLLFLRCSSQAAPRADCDEQRRKVAAAPRTERQSLSLEFGHFGCAIRALFGLRRQSGAATALWLRSRTKALNEVSCLTIRSKAASRFACRRSPRDASDPGTSFVGGTYRLDTKRVFAVATLGARASRPPRSGQRPL